MWGTFRKVLGKRGFKSKSGFYLEGGLCPTFQDETSSYPVISDCEQVCRPGEEPVLEGGSACSVGQVGSRESSYSVILGLLQLVISGSEAQQQMETHFGSQSVKSVFKPRHFQDGNSRDHLVVFIKRGISINHRSRKYLRFFLNKQTYQFTSLHFGLAATSLEFTNVVMEVKLMPQVIGIRIHQYLDDWLLRAP